MFQGFLRFSSIWALASAVFLIFAGWLHVNGYLAEAQVQLWAKAILQVDGPPGYKTSEAIYPPLPLVMTMMAHSAIGATSVPMPTLIATAVAALVAALWYVNLRDRGEYNILLALLIVLLLGTHPMFLAAISEGPELALLFLGVWIFSRGIVHLRLSGNAPDMMKVAVGLLIVGLSSSYGLLIAVGVMPFLALAARPSMFVSSPLGYLFAIAFPVACAAGSLMFVSAIFDTPLVPRVVPNVDAPGAASVALITLIAALPALLTALRLATMPAYAIPLVAAVGGVSAAVALDQMISFLSEPLLAAAPLVAVNAVALRFWPVRWDRAPAAILLLSLSWLGSAWVIGDTDRARIAAWSEALQGANAPVAEETATVARFLKGQDSILVDAERNADLIIALASIDGLVLAGTAEYELTLLGGAPRQRFIVARGNAEAALSRDQVYRRFSGLRDTPPDGYDTVLIEGDWTVLERMDF